jgi:probable HAF family extracellular repeat protein
MHRVLQSCFFLLALLGGQASAQTNARPLDIVAPPGGETIAYDMNAAGQVAAVIADDNGSQRGVFFQNGSLIELGTFGGTESVATHINSKGEIVGSARLKDHNWHAFLYDRISGMHDLGTLGGGISHGMALNNAGDVVGYADTANDDMHAFLYQRGMTMKDLGTLGGTTSNASGINNRGQVVGTATLPDQYKRAFLYDAVHGMVNLGTLGGRTSTATAINDSGVVVGASETKDRHWHAFAFDGHQMIDLGAKIGFGDSFATGINSAGHVVGTVMLDEERMSFVWRDNKMLLHHGTRSLYVMNAINDAEQVIGATYSLGLHAATMNSSAAPITDHGGKDLLGMIAMVLTLAAAVVIYRRRYRGILIAAFTNRGRWAN